MKRLRYDGPGHILEAFDKTLRRGEAASFTDAEAHVLVGDRHINVTEVPSETKRPAQFASRDAWAAYAAEIGVTVTDGMKRNEIIAAIDDPPLADGGETEPEAIGEGHTATHEEDKE